MSGWWKKKTQAGFDAAGLGGRVAEHRGSSHRPPCPVVGIGSGSSAEQHQTLLWSHWGNRKLRPSLERFLCVEGYGTCIGTGGNELAIEAAGNRDLAGLTAPSLQSDGSVLLTLLKPPQNTRCWYSSTHSFIHSFSQSVSRPAPAKTQERNLLLKVNHRTRHSPHSEPQEWCGREITNVAETNTSDLYSVLADYQPNAPCQVL